MRCATRLDSVPKMDPVSTGVVDEAGILNPHSAESRFYRQGMGHSCQLCWDQAWLESHYLTPESQAEAYERILKENEGKDGHV